MKIRPGLQLASLSDVGCQRENNEDSFAYWEPEDDSEFERLGRLAIVADGMGGCQGGQVASRIVVESLQLAYLSSPETDPQRRLLQAVQQAHANVQRHAEERPSLNGMGTTCTAFVLMANQLYFVHVGDSRLYLLREGRLQLLTRDHTLVAHLVEAGMIRSDQVEDHPQKHVLTSAVGVADAIEPDFPSEPLRMQKSDVLLLCTDGLWGQMNDSEAAEILGSRQPEDAARKLVQLAKERGGPDNITLQVARII